MGHCVVDDVRALADTDVTDAEIDVLIDILSELIDSLVTTTNPMILRGICQLWTCYRVLLKDPNARSLGEYSENRSTALQLMKDELDALLAAAGAVIPIIPSTGGVKIVAAMESI